MAQEAEKQEGTVKIAVRRYRPETQNWGPEEAIQVHNLLTTAGRDFLLTQGYDSSPGANGANYIALSTNSDGVSASDTEVADEITTGGLARAQATVTHTASTDTTYLTKTFTATAAHVDVQLVGLLTAASAGTLVREAIITPITLAINDQLLVTWQITLS